MGEHREKRIEFKREIAQEFLACETLHGYRGATSRNRPSIQTAA
jgi:hypothetical protein